MGSDSQMTLFLVAAAVGSGIMPPVQAEAAPLARPEPSAIAQLEAAGQAIDPAEIHLAEPYPAEPQPAETISQPERLNPLNWPHQPDPSALAGQPEFAGDSPLAPAPDFAAALRAMLEFQALPPGTIRYDGQTVPDPAKPRCWTRSPQLQEIDLSAVCGATPQAGTW